MSPQKTHAEVAHHQEHTRSRVQPLEGIHPVKHSESHQDWGHCGCPQNHMRPPCLSQRQPQTHPQSTHHRRDAPTGDTDGTGPDPGGGFSGGEARPWENSLLLATAPRGSRDTDTTVPHACRPRPAVTQFRAHATAGVVHRPPAARCHFRETLENSQPSDTHLPSPNTTPRNGQTVRPECESRFPDAVGKVRSLLPPGVWGRHVFLLQRGSQSIVYPSYFR